jgi:hypothetical protein
MYISHCSPSFAARRKVPSLFDSTCETMLTVPRRFGWQKLSEEIFSAKGLGWGSMRITRALLRGGDRLHPGGEKAHAASTPWHPL